MGCPRGTDKQAKYFFEEDAKKLADFHNKEKVWLPNGGIPKMLWNY